MAENRFPSLDDFEGGQTSVNDNSAAGSFLDRERALLGDDADQFASADDSKLATVEDAEDDLLGGGHDAPAFQPSSQFEDAFPEIDGTNEHVAPGGSVTGNVSSYPPPSFSTPEPEPPVITEWREKRDADITRRDALSADRKEQTIKEARQAIDDFYENYNDKKDKSIAQTRREAEEFLASRDDTTAGGTSWERIAKLVELNKGGPKGGAGAAGKERFREMLLSLRKDEKAPGASGL